MSQYMWVHAGKHTRKKQQKSRRKTAQEQNTDGKYAECDNVKKKGSEAESLNI
jgi:hypothetical protein